MTSSPLSTVEEDICRVLQEEMNVAVTPCLPDGVLTLHLVMGKTVLQARGPRLSKFQGRKCFLLFTNSLQHVLPCWQTFTIFLQVMDEYHDYYVTAAMNATAGNQQQRQRLIRAETKLQQRLIWRRGWRRNQKQTVHRIDFR